MSVESLVMAEAKCFEVIGRSLSASEMMRLEELSIETDDQKQLASRSIRKISLFEFHELLINDCDMIRDKFDTFSDHKFDYSKPEHLTKSNNKLSRAPIKSKTPAVVTPIAEDSKAISRTKSDRNWEGNSNSNTDHSVELKKVGKTGDDVEYMEEDPAVKIHSKIAELEELRNVRSAEERAKRRANKQAKDSAKRKKESENAVRRKGSKSVDTLAGNLIDNDGSNGSIDTDGSLDEAARNAKQTQVTISENIGFGNVKFLADEAREKYQKIGTEKRYVKPPISRLVEQAIAHRDKINELAITDPEQAALLSKKAKIDTAISKSKGETVKDDIGRLKKTQRKVAAKKRKTAKDWAERVKTVEDTLKQRVQKRTDNLQKRKDHKLGRRLTKKVK